MPLLILWILLLASAAAAVERPVAYRELQEPRVARIHFEHLQEKPFGNSQLRAAMLTQQGRRFRRRHFRTDLTTLRDLYRAAGYMDAQIVRRRFGIDEEDRLHIHLRIASGQRWRVGSVALEQLDSAGVGARALDARVEVRPGDVFRYGRVLQQERQMLSALNTAGYARAQVSNQVDFDRTRREAHVRFEIRAGRRMYFGPVTVEPDTLHTQRALIERQLMFAEGQLYDPDILRRSRSNLARTGLFRSVILATPASSGADSVQPVVVRLQERPYLHLESRAFASTIDRGVTGKVEHRNFLGRGNRIGADASLGRPLQGVTLYLTERNLLDSPADLTLSAGITDEFSRTQVFADPDDPRQFDLLTQLHLPLLQDSTAAVNLAGGVYDYPSVERLWKVDAALGRNWLSPRGDKRYLTQLTMNWTQSRTRPEPAARILFRGDSRGALSSPDSTGAGAVNDTIVADDAWTRILTNRAQALNLSLDVQRDTRDHQIVARRGAFLRATALFAVEFGGASTRVLDGLLEGRHYQPLGSRLVWAQALRWEMTGSVRRDRQLPQAYWKRLGGEGSVRGVERDAIQAVDGGRTGFNVRNELRLQIGKAGLVGFWDRAGVWRYARDASWQDMRDGYGVGLRWDLGLPLRFDAGWSRGFAARELYLSIGEAF